MSLKASDLAVVRSTGLLPVFGYALLVAAVAGFVAGAIVAWKWKSSASAISQNAQLRADIKAWESVAREQRQVTADQVVAFGAALGRLNTISQGREDDREENRKWLESRKGERSRVHAAAPALADLDLGPEFLRHWNATNAGPGATVPAALDPTEPGADVSGAADGHGFQSDGNPGAARHRGSHVPRLPEQQAPADRRGHRMGSDGLGLVLPRSCPRASSAGGMPLANATPGHAIARSSRGNSGGSC